MKKLGGLDASFLRCNAPYEIHHHERLARSVSLSEAAIAAAKAGPNGSALTPEECSFSSSRTR